MMNIKQDDIPRRWKSVHVGSLLIFCDVHVADLLDSGFKFSELEICELICSGGYFILTHCTETVLSVLLEIFVFSLSSKEIYWNLAGLASPTIKGSSQDRPTMPMKLSVVVKD